MFERVAPGWSVSGKLDASKLTEQQLAAVISQREAHEFKVAK